MNTSTNPAPRNPLWMGIATVLLVAVLVIVLFIFGSREMRHELRDEPAPAQETPRPAPVVPH